MIRRSTTWLVLAAGVVCTGCVQRDENPHWNPQGDYPEWTYDAPFYYRPSQELQVAEVIGQDIPIYYTNSPYFFVVHPGGYQVIGEPRVAVWHSEQDGKEWRRAGFYGVEQTHFLFKAEHDGPHWIRFVGPGQGHSKVPPGTPHRIYVVDTARPGIELTIDPPPWMDEEKKEPRFYEVGQLVTLRWKVSELHLAKDSIRLGTCFAEFPNNLIWSQFPMALASEGEIRVEIPVEATADGGMRFRMEAADKAGNVGMAMTEVLQIRGRPVDLRPWPTTQPTVRPVTASAPVAVTHPGPPHGGTTSPAPTTQPARSAPVRASDATTRPAPASAPALRPPHGLPTRGGTTNATTQPAGSAVSSPLAEPAVPQVGSEKARRIIQTATRPALPRPVGPDDLIQQTHGTPGCRLGWPLPGTLLRGRTRRTIDWMPDAAARLRDLEFQFTGDNARSWDTVASGFEPHRSVRWSVPPINSKNCRIRLVGTDPTGQRVQVAMSQRFTVQTPEEAIILDVQPLEDQNGH